MALAEAGLRVAYAHGGGGRRLRGAGDGCSELGMICGGSGGAGGRPHVFKVEEEGFDRSRVWLAVPSDVSGAELGLGCCSIEEHTWWQARLRAVEVQPLLGARPYLSCICMA
eukprot:1157588-Pelagomonas_calceolata.AAC.3